MSKQICSLACFMLYAVLQICTRSMAQVECLSAMMVGMKSRRDQIALAAEALYKMFDKGEEELVSQVSHTFHRAIDESVSSYNSE